MNQPDFAQDPSELFDIVTADGVPTGKTKRRADVHRDGDWHRAVHIWVVRQFGETSTIVFQRRGLAKDTWPGRLDATVGGHYRASEGLLETLREADEEIGIEVEPGRLYPLGLRVCVSEAGDGVIDREIQDVFLLIDLRPLDLYRPNPHELDSLVEVAIADALDLHRGAVESIAAVTFDAATGTLSETSVTLGHFVPNIDRYALRLLTAADLCFRGYPVSQV